MQGNMLNHAPNFGKVSEIKKYLATGVMLSMDIHPIYYLASTCPGDSGQPIKKLLIL